MTNRWKLLAAGGAALVIVGCGGGASTPNVQPLGAGKGGAAKAPGIAIDVLSSKAQYVSGGNALIAVHAAPGLQDKLELWLNGSRITNTLEAKGGGLEGLVSGLAVGANVLEVRHRNGQGHGVTGRIELTNHPITGPILSGPQISPYECRTVQNGLGPALDANCSANTVVSYYYKGSSGCAGSAASCFKPLADPTAPRPADLLNTTTNAGVVAPYIVRIETGTINRGVYNLAVLDNPAVGSPLPATFKPGAGWNGKLVMAFGGGGSAAFNQGVQPAATALSDVELSRGFAFINSTEMINHQHANPHLQGETAMMLKDHFIESFGVPKWTLGTGGSGGAIQQYLIGQLYPGLLDGLQPNASFPETFMPNVYECRLAANVFANDPARWTTDKQVAVQGFNPGTCVAWDLFFAGPLVGADYAPGCALTEPANVARIYNRTTNPGGDIFCSFLETNVNLFGKDADGRARRPIDNVGVQYGLVALNAGQITPAEFLDFNQQVGGVDRDGYAPVLAAGAPVPGAPNARHVADLDAVRLAHAGGFRNSFTGPGLSNVPIITLRANATAVGDIHDTMQDLIVRARLHKANGRTDNQIILSSSQQASAMGVNLLAISNDTANAWLDAIAADPAPASIDKVARNKPASATDACWDKSGRRINETQSTDPTTACNQVYPRFSTLRLAAGETMAQDGVKCSLKPVAMADYKVAFSNAEAARLRQIFPQGVCDWTVPGVNQVPLAGTYLKLPLN